MLCRFIAISILISGCGSWEKNPSREYSVEISPKFNATHQELIVQGIHSWEKALGGFLIFEIKNHGTIKINPITTDELNELHTPRVNQHFVGWCDHEGVGSKINLAVDVPDEDFRMTVQHEAGHSLGLKHSGPNTIMCEEISCSSKNITPEDLKQFAAVWDQ